MKIRDHLYFAPEVRFADVDIRSPLLAEQVASRIWGFYLQPARRLVDTGYAFASGAIIVIAIDALARLQTGRNDVGGRFRDWCEANLPSCDTNISRKFYEAFRNGLVHEARIKDGCEFSFENRETFIEIGDILSCNPRLLLDEVEGAFNDFIQSLETDSEKMDSLCGMIIDDFEYELNN